MQLSHTDREGDVEENNEVDTQEREKLNQVPVRLEVGRESRETERERGGGRGERRERERERGERWERGGREEGERRQRRKREREITRGRYM